MARGGRRGGRGGRGRGEGEGEGRGKGGGRGRGRDGGRGGGGGRGEGGGRGRGEGGGERKRKREGGDGGRRIHGGRGGGGRPSEEGRDGFVTKSQNPHPRGSPSMRNLRSIIQGTKALKPLKELWDYENIHIPRGLPLKTALQNVKNTMIQRGYYIFSIEAYAEETVFTPEVVERLRRAHVQGIIAQDYPGDEKRECSDLAMMQRISEWVEEHDPPAPLLVLTTDLDFYSVIQTLTRPRYGFDIFVSSNKSAPKEFASLPSFMLWEDLVDGTLLDGAIQNQRPPPPPPLRGPSPQRPRPEDLLVPVYWDIGTCSIPEDVRAKDVFANLEAAVRAMGFLGVYSVTVCSRSGELNGGTIDMLRKSGMIVRSLQPPTKTKKRNKMERKGYPDVELGRAMHMWAVERNPTPMLLISSDVRLSTVVSSICHVGFEIILAHNREAPRDFTRQASRCVIWSDRRAGTGLVTGGLVSPRV